MHSGSSSLPHYVPYRLRWYFAPYWSAYQNFWQDEGKESQGAKRGGEGTGTEHPYGQSSICSWKGANSYPAKNQSQGISTSSRGESGHGRMIWMLTLVLLHLAIIHHVVLKWPLIVRHCMWKQKFCLGLEKNHFPLLRFIYNQKVVVMVLNFKLFLYNFFFFIKELFMLLV